MTVITDQEAPAAKVVNGRNVSRVDFNSADGGGYFAQVDATTWIERHPSLDRQFTFQECERRQGLVLLKDSSRNMTIILDASRQDVPSQWVRWVDGSTYRELYPIVGVFAVPHKAVFRSLKEFNDWFAGGGEQRAGLPPDSMRPLDALVLELRTHIRQIIYDLEILEGKWGKVVASKAAGLTDSLLAQAVAQLASLNTRTSTLLSQVTRGRVLVVGADGLVRGHIEQHDRNIGSANTELEQARTAQELARLLLLAAQRAVQDSGFWDGFVTGITFGLKNPTQEKINEANNAVREVNVRVAKVNDLIYRLNQAHKELVEERLVIRNLSALDGALTDYQNNLSRAEWSLSKGHDAAAKAAATASNTLAAYYTGKADKEMRELFLWADSFRSVI